MAPRLRSARVTSSSRILRDEHHTPTCAGGIGRLLPPDLPLLFAKGPRVETADGKAASDSMLSGHQWVGTCQFWVSRCLYGERF